jgi:hypothetical protein
MDLLPGWRAGPTTLVSRFSYLYPTGSIAGVETGGATVVHSPNYQIELVRRRNRWGNGCSQP